MKPPEIDELPAQPRKGRGAVTNRTGRYEAETRHRTDDGWAHEDEAEDAPPLRTRLHVDTARTIISRNESPDILFDRSVNPYRGCEHGCIYCFARPTHAWLGLSPGLDFETQLFYKPDAPELLEAELRKPGYAPAVMALGTNTDPYQPVERELKLTRRVIEVLARFNHPLGIVTKSALIARDIDILAPIAEKGLAAACISLSTLDRDLARALEPRAATPPWRLETIRRLAEAGIPVAVLTSPIIPGLNDHTLEKVLDAAVAAGATAANWTLLRLPLEIAGLFQEWLEAHAPDRARRVMSLIRQTHGGKLYKSGFGERMRGEGPVAEMVRTRFNHAARKLGLDRKRWTLDTSQFSPPPRPGDQMSLF